MVPHNSYSASGQGQMLSTQASSQSGQECSSERRMALKIVEGVHVHSRKSVTVSLAEIALRLNCLNRNHTDSYIPWSSNSGSHTINSMYTVWLANCKFLAHRYTRVFPRHARSRGVPRSSQRCLGTRCLMPRLSLPVEIRWRIS
jgi:hypothetical protein